MPLFPNAKALLHGGDYNPDQWLHIPGIIDADFELMDKSGCNTFSVAIFGWGQYETNEGEYNFAWLDDIFDRAKAGDKKLFLASPSGARPSWLACNYEETCRVNDQGRRLPWETRHNHCWSSPIMRKNVWRINQILAERYGKHPALAGWHISNEYNGSCYCPLCLEQFAKFLQKRYETLENLNQCYWSAFWSHTFTDWSQVNPCDRTLDTASLDWMRFNSWQVADFMKLEIEALRTHSDAPVTTNMMGVFQGLDYWRLAPLCDFICDDCYPSWRYANVEKTAAHFGMLHSMHYAMQNKPFLIMESCPGVPNYQRPPRMRRANELEREALLALGHGADGTMYFQWRKSKGNAEKIHGAVVGHDGTDQSRQFQDVAAVGKKLTQAAEIIDAVRVSEIALIHDWESYWALMTSKGYDSAKDDLVEYVRTHFQALWRYQASIDVIESECDFSKYKVLVAPMLYMMKPGVIDKLVNFVKNGGQLVMTYLSGYVDHNNHCFAGGNPGYGLRDLFGIWAEDIDILAEGDVQNVALSGFDFSGLKRQFAIGKFGEYIHNNSAEVVGHFTEDILAGRPAITKKQHGSGTAWYIGADLDLDFLTDFYQGILQKAQINPVLPDMPTTIHVAKRSGADADYYFLLNLTTQEQMIKLPWAMVDIWNTQSGADFVVIPARGGALLKDKR